VGGWRKMGRRHRLGRLATILLLLRSATAVADPASIAGVEVQGTAFIVRLVDGRTLGPEQLVGSVLEVSDDQGRQLTVHVDDFILDPRDPEREVVLYHLTTPGEGGARQELCKPDPAGERWAFPLAGTWTASGEHRADPELFNVTCSSGAIGKCVRLGYKPWKRLPAGGSHWAHHQACVRMLRADYCGDGASFTRDGTLIDLYDRLGIQRDEPGPGMRFEAGWGEDGATCVARVRIPEKASLDGLARRCPGRLAGRVGAVCTETEAVGSPATLLLNRS
jgi:ADYC domain